MGSLTAYDAIKSYLDGKKTPYQLDLEVKDRKPSIIPKVGDKVKIKSREWYEKWNDGGGGVNVSGRFIPPMAKYCGKVLTVEEFRFGDFKMKEDKHKWIFSLEMFEEVYPMQEQISSTFPKIDLISNKDLNGKPITYTPFPLKAGELIVAKTTVCSMIEDTAKRIAAYTSVQGLTAKPKLKQIKTTHLIKLKKL